MKELFQKLEKYAKDCAPGEVEVRDEVVTIIVNYAQNLDCPSMNKDQPGETYYFSQ